MFDEVCFSEIKGNQVKILSDPVTVNRETDCIEPLCVMHEKAQSSSEICKSGNLLGIRRIASEESNLPP